MEGNNSQLITINQQLEHTSNLETKVEKSWKSDSYNAFKLPILQVFREKGERGATVKEVAEILHKPRELVESRVRNYHRWGWLTRRQPPIRPGTKRKRGRPKYVYWITEKGLDELMKLEQLDARNMPLKPREYKVPVEGKLGEVCGPPTT